MTTSRPDSPCIDVCTLDPSTGVCVGCFRLLDEIAAWSAYSDGERASVLSRLPDRRARFADGLRADARKAAASRVPATCSQCGASFACGAGGSADACWCASYPPVSPSTDGAGAGCLCPRCLALAATG